MGRLPARDDGSLCTASCDPGFWVRSGLSSLEQRRDQAGNRYPLWIVAGRAPTSYRGSVEARQASDPGRVSRPSFSAYPGRAERDQRETGAGGGPDLAVRRAKSTPTIAANSSSVGRPRTIRNSSLMSVLKVLQGNVAVLLGWQALPLGSQRPQPAHDLHPRGRRLDDRVDVS